MRLWGGVFHLLRTTWAYPAAGYFVSQRLFQRSHGHISLSRQPEGVCWLVIKIWGRMGDGAARFCRDVACWLMASGEAALLKSPWFGKRVPPSAAGEGGWFYGRLAGRRTEWIWQKFWKGFCAVLEREGESPGERRVSRGRPLCRVKGFEAWIC